MPAYHEAWRIGEPLQIADMYTLLQFQREWSYHHPLQEAQMDFAGKLCVVRSIGFWHGGDCLYELDTYVLDSPSSRYSHKEAVPGYWLEPCLHDQNLSDWHIPLPPASDVYVITAEICNQQPVVVVRTQDGMECLVQRHLQNERQAALMTEVARMRNTLSFEWRYEFHGVAQDALQQRARERHNQSK